MLKNIINAMSAIVGFKGESLYDLIPCCLENQGDVLAKASLLVLSGSPSGAACILNSYADSATKEALESIEEDTSKMMCFPLLIAYLKLFSLLAETIEVEGLLRESGLSVPAPEKVDYW